MKALSVLGTSSGAGKSWTTVALCAWLHKQGVRVAPFKAQNMSNNAWATLDGGEIARAQAVQAEACGLRASVEMNPILLKPSGSGKAQLVLRGKAQSHFTAGDYYGRFPELWSAVRESLDYWKTASDVLILEGAGSPVELNLQERDLVNLRPIEYLDGRWLLVGDIDRGGIFAQLAGTWQLLTPAQRARGLGAIVNRFRGDLSLFEDPQDWLAPHAPGFPILGTVPFRPDLQPEEEDGLSESDEDRGLGNELAWIRFPHAANVTDCQPWWLDEGVRVRWVNKPEQIANARAIVLPGSKNTLADLRWLRSVGLDRAIVEAARRGVLVIGLCGGLQILGEQLSDAHGVAGDAGEEIGLGLLPIATEFTPDKIVRQVTARSQQRRWSAYEIHMGRTRTLRTCDPLHEVEEDGALRPEGYQNGNVCGTYLHGWFEAPEVRTAIASASGFSGYKARFETWLEYRQSVYRAMADHWAAHVNLEPIKRYLEL
jgi:adenosylcobyric acid synthase